MIWEKGGTPAQDPDPLELEHADEKLDECLTVLVHLNRKV